MTLNIGLFQRDQLVYYYCDFYGSGNIEDEARGDEIGMVMDWYEKSMPMLVTTAASNDAQRLTFIFSMSNAAPTTVTAAQPTTVTSTLRVPTCRPPKRPELSLSSAQPSSFPKFGCASTATETSALPA